MRATITYPENMNEMTINEIMIYAYERGFKVGSADSYEEGRADMKRELLDTLQGDSGSDEGEGFFSGSNEYEEDEEDRTIPPIIEPKVRCTINRIKKVKLDYKRRLWSEDEVFDLFSIYCDIGNDMDEYDYDALSIQFNRTTNAIKSKLNKFSHGLHRPS